MKTLLTQDQLEEGVSRLAELVNRDYHENPLTIIGVMTGSIILLADLIRLLKMPLRVGVVQASSYRDGTDRAKLRINAELMPDIRGKDVLLVDDIFDTGHTLREVELLMSRLEPQTLRSAVLLNKIGPEKVDVRPDYTVFDIPDEFVVGYGLDYRDSYRNLPYLAVLEEEDLKETEG